MIISRIYVTLRKLLHLRIQKKKKKNSDIQVFIQSSDYSVSCSFLMAEEMTTE